MLAGNVLEWINDINRFFIFCILGSNVVIVTMFCGTNVSDSFSSSVHDLRRGLYHKKHRRLADISQIHNDRFID